MLGAVFAVRRAAVFRAFKVTWWSIRFAVDGTRPSLAILLSHVGPPVSGIPVNWAIRTMGSVLAALAQLPTLVISV